MAWSGQWVMITVTAPLQLWAGEEGSSHFMRLPDEVSGEIRMHAMAVPRGFGSVRVEATIEGTNWRTSVFRSKSGGYFLPVKIDVCRKTGIKAGEPVTVTLDLL